MFEVIIVEQIDDGLATLTPAEFSASLTEAQAWADRFNARELEQSIDAWAVVRRKTSAPNVHHSAAV